MTKVEPRSIDRLITKAQDVVAGMSPRDRVLALGLAVSAAVLMLGAGLWWMDRSVARLRARVEERADALAFTETQAAEYAGAQARLGELQAKLREHAGTDLSAFMESAATKAGVEVAGVKKTSSVSDAGLEETLYDVTLNDLTTRQMADFLYEVETNGYPVRIRSAEIDVKARRGERLLSLKLDVSAFAASAEDDG